MARAEDQRDEKTAQVYGQAPLPPIALVHGGAGAGAAPMRWTALLVWFMRTMALVWIAWGLYYWSVILGANPLADDFMTMGVVLQATIIFFAVADLVAAIGLWLASPWGGVLWLICAICEAAAPLVGVKLSVAGPIGIGVNTALVAVYFALSWLASRERA